MKMLFVIATLATATTDPPCPCRAETNGHCYEREPICLIPARSGSYSSLRDCEIDRLHFFGEDDKYQCVKMTNLFR